MKLTLRGPPRPQPGYLEKLGLSIVCACIMPFLGVLIALLGLLVGTIMPFVLVAAGLTGNITIQYKEKDDG